jgi:hypothetical protein
MSKKVNTQVRTFDDMGKRFVSAWHRLEGGRATRDVSEPVVDAESSLGNAPGRTSRAKKARKSK